MDASAASEIELASTQLAALFKRHMPEVVSAVHLVGSATDGDFRPGRSDLDFVGVLVRPATADDIEGLAIVHRLYASDPTLAMLCGIWVTEEDLAAGPDATADGPTSSENRLIGKARGNRNPVTWFTLADQSRTLFGTLDHDRLWRDPGRLASWMRENVEAYWFPWHERASRLLTLPGIKMLGRKAPTWGVLGIARLHYTLATGRIASKSGAGEHALASFDPRWRPIIEECLRYRQGSGSLYRNPFERRADALHFVRMVIEAIRGMDAGYCASE